MPRVHVTGGYLNVEGMSGGYPDNSLPGDQPGIDNSLPGMQPGIDNSLPPPPPSVWPPPTVSHPIVPVPPGGSTPPPGAIWPPPFPSHGLPGQGQPGGSPGAPTHPIQPPSGGQPGTPSHPIAQPPGQPSHPISGGTYWMLCYCPALGWRYVVVDPSLSIDNALPGSQPTPTPHK